MGVTSIEAMNSVFHITNENNSFLLSTQGRWIPENAQQTINKIKELLELDERDLRLHIAALRGKGHEKNIEGDEYDLADLDNSLLRNERNEKLKKNKYSGLLDVSTDMDNSIGCEHVNIEKNAQSVDTDFIEGTQCVSFSFTDSSHNKYRNLEDMVYILQINHDEVVDILNIKYVDGSTKGYTIPPGVNEIIDINFLIKSLLHKEMKVNITIDDVRLQSN